MYTASHTERRDREVRDEDLGVLVADKQDRAQALMIPGSPKGARCSEQDTHELGSPVCPPLMQCDLAPSPSH